MNLFKLTPDKQPANTNRSKGRYRKLAFFGCIVLIAVVGPIVNKAVAEEIYISDKGPSATIIEMTGQGTANASLQAKLTKIGAEEYCERDPGGLTIEYGGELTKQGCVEQVLADWGSFIHIAAADCMRGLLRDTSGRTLRHVGPAQFGGIRWVEIDTDEDIGNCGACNDVAATSQFELMCPFFGR